MEAIQTSEVSPIRMQSTTLAKYSDVYLVCARGHYSGTRTSKEPHRPVTGPLGLCDANGVHSAPCQGAAGRGSSTASAIGAVHVIHVLPTRHAQLLLVPTMLLLLLVLHLLLVWYGLNRRLG